MAEDTAADRRNDDAEEGDGVDGADRGAGATPPSEADGRSADGDEESADDSASTNTDDGPESPPAPEETSVSSTGSDPTESPNSDDDSTGATTGADETTAPADTTETVGNDPAAPEGTAASAEAAEMAGAAEAADADPDAADEQAAVAVSDDADEPADDEDDEPAAAETAGTADTDPNAPGDAASGDADHGDAASGYADHEDTASGDADHKDTASGAADGPDAAPGAANDVDAAPGATDDEGPAAGAAEEPTADTDTVDVPEDVQQYARFKKVDGSRYERVNDFLRDRTYITAREWAIARLCADFRTETGVEMTKIGENLPELVPFMTDTYTPQAVNQARASFEEKVRMAGATFLYGAMCDFFTAEELDDLIYEVTEVAKFLLEVEGVDLAVEDELETEDRISDVMREVRTASEALRNGPVECPECGHEISNGEHASEESEE